MPFPFGAKAALLSNPIKASIGFPMYPMMPGLRTYYISSFDKNGKKNWEIKPGRGGQVYPLKDGRFFYAQDDAVSAYDKQGKIIWETDVEGSSNSNYSLNQKEELVVNLLSSPQTSTVYCTIRIDGEKTTYPAIPDLTSCFTYPYPLGGYITEGFTGGDNYKWYVSRLKEDFSVEWTYSGEADEGNFYISDISADGRILFTGTREGGYFLRELGPDGKEMHIAKYAGTFIKAAYFQDKIVVAGDKARILKADFRVEAEFGDLRYPQIQILEDAAFIYTSGGYDINAAVRYDGYCQKYDQNSRQVSSKVFKESDRFVAVGKDGRQYYRK